MLIALDVAVILLLAAVGAAALGPPATATSSGALAALPLLHVALLTPMLVHADLDRRRLPNTATLSGLGLVTGVSVALLFDGVRGREALLALAALVLVLGGGTVAAAAGLVGMGDVKLAALLAGSLLLVHPRSVIVAAVAASVIGGVAGLGRFLRGTGRGGTVPYGPALLGGFWGSLVELASPAVL